MTLLQIEENLQKEFQTRNLTCFRAGDNLANLVVALDFDWESLKGNAWHQFTHGKKLAQFVHAECPAGRVPVLYLTDEEERPRFLNLEGAFVAIVPFTLYLETASPDPARSFFQIAAKVAIGKLLEFAPDAIESGELAIFLDNVWSKGDKRKELVGALEGLYNDTPDGEPEPEQEQKDVGLLLALLAHVAKSKTAQAALANAVQSDVKIPNIEQLFGIFRLQTRRETVETFAKQLALAGTSEQWSEPQWEAFFRKNPWLLGLNLKSCVFLSEVQGQPDLAGKNLAGRGGQRGDSMMASSGAARFTCLVALKAPEAALTEANQYRNKTYRVGPEVVGGVAQVQSECHRWEVSPDNYSKTTDLRFKQGIHTICPDGIVVVGHWNSIKDNEDKIASFERYRASLHGVRIVTFDELLERARALVDMEDPSQKALISVPSSNPLTADLG